MGQLRAGVIGLGRMGSTFDDEIEMGGVFFLPYCHAPSYVASPQTRLVAGADPHPQQREAFAARWDLERAHVHADYRDMLARERLDVVSVCTSARLRSAIVEDCARAGVKAIWAEKPIALSLREADAMVATCRREGVVLAINCSRRWHPLFDQARRLIQRGELGEILHVTGYGACGLSSSGSHLIDTLRFLADDDVEWLFGDLVPEPTDDRDREPVGNGYLSFQRGVKGFLRSMACGAANWDFEVIGTQGRIRSSNHGLDFEFHKLIPGGIRGAGLPVKVPYPWPTRMRGMGEIIIADLVQCLDAGDSPRCAGEDGLKALEIALALRASHDQGGIRVNLPLADRGLGLLSDESRHDDTPALIRNPSLLP